MRFSGLVYDGEWFRSGYAEIDRGIVTEVEFTDCPCEHIIMPKFVDTHTHVGDAGLMVRGKMTLEELVAPPDGLKHRYLAETDDNTIVKNIQMYTDTMYRNDISHFIDFREGGVKGCALLRDAATAPGAVILGRPVSPEYDCNEVDSILDVADGIGISGISDMDAAYLDALADHVHRRGKRLAMHVSERVREDIGTVISMEPDIVVHMCEATDADMMACADNSIHAVVCPRSNLYFGKVPRFADLRRNGVTVSLGTDNAMLCTPDIRMEMRALADIAKNMERDISHSTMDARKLLNRGMEMGISAGMSEFMVLPSTGRLFSDIISGSVSMTGRGERNVI